MHQETRLSPLSLTEQVKSLKMLLFPNRPGRVGSRVYPVFGAHPGDSRTRPITAPLPRRPDIYGSRHQLFLPHPELWLASFLASPLEPRTLVLLPSASLQPPAPSRFVRILLLPSTTFHRLKGADWSGTSHHVRFAPAVSGAAGKETKGQAPGVQVAQRTQTK